MLSFYIGLPAGALAIAAGAIAVTYFERRRLIARFGNDKALGPSKTYGPYRS